MPKIKNMRTHRNKYMNYYKLQSETENTINREINELKVKIDNIKEEVTHNMENLRKMNETETQVTMEGHSSRLE
jgi:predicted  nucleic acid-binding Zn-ribbon protein